MLPWVVGDEKTSANPQLFVRVAVSCKQKLLYASHGEKDSNYLTKCVLLAHFLHLYGSAFTLSTTIISSGIIIAVPVCAVTATSQVSAIINGTAVGMQPKRRFIFVIYI